MLNCVDPGDSHNDGAPGVPIIHLIERIIHNSAHTSPTPRTAAGPISGHVIAVTDGRAVCATATSARFHEDVPVSDWFDPGHADRGARADTIDESLAPKRKL